MDRFQRLRDILVQQELDALYIRDTSNIAYLTDFDGVFDEERAHSLLVDSERILLHTDSRYANACKDAATKARSPIQIDDEVLSHPAWLAKQDAHPTLGIEDTISLAEFRKLEKEFSEVPTTLVETTGLVIGMRTIKDAAEIERLRAAQAITDAAFAYIAEFIKPGLTERDVQRELDNYMLSHGASALAFPTIVATGANGANPHAQPTDTPLEAGQCVVIDFGAKAGGYCSDMTRTIFIGEPDDTLRHAYEVLREANETVEAMLKPGITGAAAHEHALEVLTAGGFENAMGHGLGHGVGMDIHEEPVLAPRNKEPLVAGNVVTVEPGIYIPGSFGMRLEDFGIVTENGFDVFTQTTHDMVVI